MTRKKTEPRHCYYALRDKNYGGSWHVVMVYDGEAGYRLVNPDTDLGGPCSDEAMAERCAAYWNKALKLSPESVRAIVQRSMDAGPVALAKASANP